MASVLFISSRPSAFSSGWGRYLAAIAGAALVVVFLQTVVRHPAEGWLASIGCGVPMVWLIQFARSGCAWPLGSLGWYAAWYALFSVTWLAVRALQGLSPGAPLGPQASIGVFLGTVAFMGGACRAQYWRSRLRWRI